MGRRKGSMFRSVLLALLIVGAGGGLLLLAQGNKPIPLPDCAPPVAATPPAPPPIVPPADPAAAPAPVAPPAPQPVPTPAADPLRLYMPDGQLISHGLTVHVTTTVTKSQNPRLRLFRSHAITEAAEDEDSPLIPDVVVPGQQWTETERGQTIVRTGTILMFNTSSMNFAGKAMVRARPMLYWDGGACVLGPNEINVGDIRFAIAWTAAIVVITLLLVLILARAKKENPMLLLTGVDGHLALSQAQIACWTIVVGSVVLGYGLIRRQIPEIPGSLIVLMGASLATGGLAYFQDIKKATAAAAKGGGMPTLDWRWGDLIRIFHEDRPPELSLSKAQMLFWTVLLLLLFLSKSILEGGIWEVPWPLVALMGFSQAGYLAPKVAETNTPTPPPANPPAGGNPPPGGNPAPPVP